VTTRTNPRQFTGRNPFARWYRRWNLVYAAGIVALVAAAEIPPLTIPACTTLALWVGIALFRLVLFSKKAGITTTPSPWGRWANRLTAVRAVAAVTLVLAAAVFLSPGLVNTISKSWWLVGALLIVESTDFFDGRLARQGPNNRFGPIWDMETDAAFTLSLAIVNRHIFLASPLVLLIGLMRYLYVLLWRHEYRPTPAPHPPRVLRVLRLQTLYSKTTTATLVTAMIVIMAPPVGAILRETVVALVLGMQLVSFGWDMYLQRRMKRDDTAL
jgi:phosphatidylglycerophosphate synthase